MGSGESISSPIVVALKEAKRLMESPTLNNLITIHRDLRGLGRPRRSGPLQGTEPEAWQVHVGGYQALHNWLKDRKPSFDDLIATRHIERPPDGIATSAP